jgi:hypothetical protein
MAGSIYIHAAPLKDESFGLTADYAKRSRPGTQVQSSTVKVYHKAKIKTTLFRSGR